MTLTLPFKPMLAHVYDPKKHDISGWWVSEKLDGVRAIWTGQELISRNNKPIYAPAWWLKQLPKGLSLDGELFLGRGRFQQTVSAVRKKSPVDDEWRQVRYMIFDQPGLPMPFCERIQAADKYRGGDRVCVLHHSPIDLLGSLEAYYESLVEGGAEGLMLRDPHSLYENKRSHKLLKMKPEHELLAMIVDYLPGKGKHEGRIGAAVCHIQGKEEIQFNVGTGFSDSQRENPPAFGTVIKVGHMGFTDDGCPRFPTFLGAEK